MLARPSSGTLRLQAITTAMVATTSRFIGGPRASGYILKSKTNTGTMRSWGWPAGGDYPAR
jgi:hypothetical protein